MLNTRSAQLTRHLPGNAGESRAQSVCFSVAFNPEARDIRRCKKAWRKKYLPILVVPRSDVSRARDLAAQEGATTFIEILDLETLIGTSILLEGGEDRPQCAYGMAIHNLRL